MQHSGQVLEHLVVSEPQYPPTLTPKEVITDSVAIVGVLSAICFDDETCLNTGEISDVWRDWMLAPKTEPEPIVPEFSP